MKVSEIIAQILPHPYHAVHKRGSAFAPVNIALAKYWGKRQIELNLPMTGSLSIALPEKGAFTEIIPIDQDEDIVQVNGKILSPENNSHQRLTKFLDYFRPTTNYHFKIITTMNVPISAGLASSACSYAAIILALNDLFDWNLSLSKLSVLARLGSGSACRSLWSGFVEWLPGNDPSGMDSFARPLNETWEDLRIGLLIITDQKKIMDSRNAMLHAQATSPFYETWIKQIPQTIKKLTKTIKSKDINLFGEIVEANALAMHATMHTAKPAIHYTTAATLEAMRKIWHARKKGLSLYFTQDAGPNLKLLFLKNDLPDVQNIFPELDVTTPFHQRQKETQVIWVDEKDRSRGALEKRYAHEHALCHRAFSIFIFRKNEFGKCEVLLQQRHGKKLHCGNLWTNTCCSHPMPSENIFAAGQRRLQEEMGMQVKLYPRGVFHYIAPFSNGLTENEVDHVLIGYDKGDTIKPDPNEVQDYAWIEIDTLKSDLENYPAKYTPWFATALKIALGHNYQNLLSTI